MTRPRKLMAGMAAFALATGGAFAVSSADTLFVRTAAPPGVDDDRPFSVTIAC
ncbi:hypothetical protein ACFV4F_38130 [Kitasatospora sp. NPDC059722]|uniref:hypothetical protein n=1 Tax=Kitasatospora sp. NPDC059722 TaxID=3346925 RepID=UPI0036C0FB78